MGFSENGGKKKTKSINCAKMIKDSKFNWSLLKGLQSHSLFYLNGKVPVSLKEKKGLPLASAETGLFPHKVQSIVEISFIFSIGYFL